MNGTEQLQFVPLRKIKIQHDSIVHFALHTYGNDAIITYPCKESLILTNINEPDITGKIPYNIQSVEVPKERTLSNLIKDVDFRSIYAKLKVLERQEIGLDPIIVADASLEPPKPNILQAHLTPTSSTVQSKKLIAITNYGECLIFYKNNTTIATKHWDNVICNLTKFLIKEVYPTNKSATSSITQYADLRALLDGLTCTACAWHDNGEMIFVATAAGCLLVFKFDESTAALELYFQLSTNIGRVSYLKAFDNFVIASSNNGLISLYKLIPNTEDNGALLVEQGLLWTDADELSCTQLIVQHNQTPSGGYTILCAKAAFVIAFLLSQDGNLLGSAHVRIPDIKVTGIALFLENEYIVSTIRCKIFRIRFNYAVKANVALELSLKSEEVFISNSSESQFNAIYGVGTTMNKAIWFFLMNDSRNNCTRETARYSVLLLCKPSTMNLLEIMNHLNYDTIDPYMDIVWSFRMDAWCSEGGAQYAAYMPLNNDFQFPDIMDREFLRKLQIRWEIANVKMRHTSHQHKTFNETYLEELQFLQLSIQVVHILLRLEFLRQELSVSLIDGLSVFQQKAAFFMHKAFKYFIEKLSKNFATVAVEEGQNPALNVIKLNFCELACQQMASRCLPAQKCVFEDVCFVCNGIMDDKTYLCSNCDNSYRCSVSFMPLPMFCRLQCTQCSVLAYNDEHNSNLLSELFSSYKAVKCTFCCASFVE